MDNYHVIYLALEFFEYL